MIDFKIVASTVTRTLGRGGLIGSKYAPEILTGTGVVGVVATAVLASKATLNLSPVVEKARTDIDLIHKVRDGQSTGNYDVYTKEEAVQDLVRVYIRTGIDLIKLYTPTILVGGLSIACLIGSTKILRARNIALAAAYEGISRHFKSYRNRVVEEFGEDKDRQFATGARTQTLEVVEDGKTVKKEVEVHDPLGISPYAKFFDESNPHWERRADVHLMFLRHVQDMMNNRLQATGHVFLNEVYDALGITRTSQGAVVGWVLGSGGDDYIDFNIYDGQSDVKRAFVNGDERAILLDFNVDGVIWDKI